MVGMGVGVAVDMAVLVGAMVVVGKGVAMGKGVGVGADTDAQADNIRLTSKNIVHERFIVFNFPFSSYCCPI
jgi:tetrahydrodipicolinate N-succinyltransferase